MTVLVPGKLVQSPREGLRGRWLSAAGGDRGQAERERQRPEALRTHGGSRPGRYT